MFQGKTKAAIHLLIDSDRDEVMQLNDPVSPESSDFLAVLDAIRGKHPPSQPCSKDSHVSSGLDPPTVHPIIYERINAHCIRRAALVTFDVRGPSGTGSHC